MKPGFDSWSGLVYLFPQVRTKRVLDEARFAIKNKVAVNT
jgi:hypothetical protein